MTERYDGNSARHYAAFRPPLHRLILERVMGPHERFRAGLDVGCGTGYSAVALAGYCDQVLGLDPSGSMLERAQRHPKITYIQGSGDALSQLPLQPFGVVTFAGSLVYAKTDKLRRELRCVCAPGGTILAYDFEVLLNEAMAMAGVECAAVSSEYDHRANLSGWTEFAIERSGTERLRLEVTGREMAHVLLSDSNRYDAFAKHFPGSDPFEATVAWLERAPGAVQLAADVYFTRYRFLGDG